MWMSNALLKLPLFSKILYQLERLTIAVMIRAGNATLDVVRFLLFRKTNRSRCIVVFRAGALGDFIVALPALRLLRKHYPVSKIVLMTVTSLHPRWNNQSIVSGGLVLGQHLLDETLFIPGLSRKHWGELKHVRRRILQLNPDMCIMLPFVGERFTSRMVKMILLRLLGCRTNLYGYHTRSNLTCFRRIQHRLNMFEHQVEAPITALKELEIDCDEVVFEIGVSDNDVETVDSWWRQLDLDDPSLFCVAVSPFAKQKLKCWPIENFREIGSSLLSRFPNIRLIIIGGPQDRALGDSLEAIWGARSINFAGRASLLQSAEVIRRCKLFIGNDSGPSHLAAAVGISVVTIFSSFVFPELWRPWGPRSQIIRHSVPCEFCFTENGNCPKGTNECLDKISVSEVLSRCLTVLEDLIPADDSSRIKNAHCARLI